MTNIKTIALLLYLSSCIEVGFRQPQPQNAKILETVPTDLITFYSKAENDSTTGNNILKKADISVDSALSENAILKKWKGKYFYNQREDSLWRVFMIVPVKNNAFDTYQLDGGNEETRAILKGITKVEEVKSEDGEIKLLIVDPSPSEFKKIVKSKAFEKVEIF